MTTFFGSVSARGWVDGRDLPRAVARALQVAGFCLWALSPSSPAATYVWTQTNGGTYNWTDSTNWDIGGFPNAAGDVVVMTNRLGGHMVIQVGGTYALGTLILGSPMVSNFNYTLISNGPGNLVFSNTAGPALVWKPHGVSGVADYFALPLSLGTNLVVTNQTGGGIEFNDLIREIGPQSVDIVSANGSGYVVFRQTNTFSGGAWLRAGITVLGANGQGATNNPTSGPLGSGTIHLAGGNVRSTTYVAHVVVINPVVFESNATFPTSSNESTLTFAGTVTLSNGNRTLTVDMGSIVPTSGLRITGNVVDGGSGLGLIKAGTGNLWLCGSNTYGGGTLISSGALWVSNALGESNVAALGTGGVTNNSQMVLTATNGFVLKYGGLNTALWGTGTNTILRPSLGTNQNTCDLPGDYSGFSGVWAIGPDALPGAGKVRFTGADSSATTHVVYTNAAIYLPGGNRHATAILHGGDTGESLGQLRLDGGAVWKGPVWIAGPMTGVGDGHFGCYTGVGTIQGSIGETFPGMFDIRKSGRSNVVLTGTNTFSGNFTILEGGVLVGAPLSPWGTGPLGSNVTVTLSNSTDVALGLNGYDASIGALSGGGTLGGGVDLETNSLFLGAMDLPAAFYSGILSGTGKLVKVQTNWQYLLGTNTYSGGTIFSNGVLGVGANSCLGSGRVDIYPPTKQMILTNGTVLTNDFTFFKGGSNNSGSGFFHNPYSGTSYLSNGTLLFLAGPSTGGHFGANLVVDSTVTTTNGTEILTRTGTTTFRGVGNYSLLGMGFGTIKLGRDDALPTSTKVRLSWATAGTQSMTHLDLAGFNQTLVSITNAGGGSNTPNIGNSSTNVDSTLTLTGTSFYYGNLSDHTTAGSMKLRLTLDGGNLTAAGTNTYSGTTLIGGGTFRAGVTGVPGRGGAFGSNSAIVLSNGPGSTLDLNGFDNAIGSLSGGGASGGNVTLGSGTLTIGTADSNTSFDGVISGTGGVVKAGTGSQTLTGGHVYTGPTLITNGTLVITGSLAAASGVTVSNGGALMGTGIANGAVAVGMGGIVAPGLPGTNAAVFTVGSASFLTGSKYVMDLDGAAPTNDLLVATGAVVCGGNLVATNVTNSTNGSVYAVIRASNVTGTFSGIPDNGFLYQKGRLFQVRYTSTNVTLRDIGNVAPPPELEVTNPGPLSYWNGTSPISGVATNQDVSLSMPSVYAMTNGGAWVFLGVTNEWTSPVSVSNLSEGTNLYSFMSFLSNGLTNQVSHTNIVDKTAPGVPSISGGANPFINQTSVTLAATDNFSLDRIFYTTDGSVPDSNALSVAGGGAVTLTNACTMVVIARDMAGNWGGTNAVAFAKVPNPVGGGSIGAIDPNPFRPGNGNLTVSFQRQNLDRVEMSIYDIQGRLVADLKSTTDSALFRADFMWDGKTVSGQVAGRGMYLVIPRVAGVVRSDLARKVYLP